MLRHPRLRYSGTAHVFVVQYGNGAIYEATAVITSGGAVFDAGQILASGFDYDAKFHLGSTTTATAYSETEFIATLGVNEVVYDASAPSP